MLGNPQKQYNHLNLPTSVIFGTTGQIDYIYDATGMKQKKVVTENGNTNTTIYAGGFMYLNNEMEFFPHAEGYVEPVAQTSGSVKGSSGGVTTYSSFKYVFQYKDHLGNVRLSYADNDLNGSISTSEIIEESNYYPFGLKQLGYNSTVSGGNDLAQKWKYNGIEYNQDLGINLYEMDMRQYDPAIARWTSLDPVVHFEYSTYSAFDNNPVFWADPSGANSSTGPLALRQYNKTGNADALGTGLFASGTFDFMKPASGGSSASSSSGGGTNPYKNFFSRAGQQTANGNFNVTPFKPGGNGISSDSLGGLITSSMSLLTAGSLDFLKSQSRNFSLKYDLFYNPLNQNRTLFSLPKNVTPKVKFTFKGLGYGLSAYNLFQTEENYENGLIDNGDRYYSHSLNAIGTALPGVGLGLGVGDYLGRRYHTEIADEISTEGTTTVNIVSYILQLGGIPATKRIQDEWEAKGRPSFFSRLFKPKI